MLTNELNTIFLCLYPELNPKTYRQLLLITQALLAMTGRITMLNISPWAGLGASYRTIQRFFASQVPWEYLNWAIIRKVLLTKTPTEIVIAGDATTVFKSGKQTFGLGKFFSSIHSRAVKALAFQTLSLLDVNQQKSWPLIIEQILPVTKETQAFANLETKPKRGRGGPKGSKNKNQRHVELSREMKQIQNMLLKLLKMLEGVLVVTHFVYDGAFGNNAAVQMTTQVGLHLISKLRCNSSLYFQWNGDYLGRGRRRIYGDKIDYSNLPSA